MVTAPGPGEAWGLWPVYLLDLHGLINIFQETSCFCKRFKKDLPNMGPETREASDNFTGK